MTVLPTCFGTCGGDFLQSFRLYEMAARCIDLRVMFCWLNMTPSYKMLRLTRYALTNTPPSEPTASSSALALALLSPSCHASLVTSLWILIVNQQPVTLRGEPEWVSWTFLKIGADSSDQAEQLRRSGPKIGVRNWMKAGKRSG